MFFAPNIATHLFLITLYYLDSLILAVDHKFQVIIYSGDLYVMILALSFSRSSNSFSVSLLLTILIGFDFPFRNEKSGTLSMIVATSPNNLIKLKKVLGLVFHS
ncbi:hypothetical protein FLA4_08460 [Candidatus Rickettsia kotlanii]|nr:hypothetical protein FLA4_08460 [Candidatus Rickettsia kotlanii]BDU61679.1 hypothetical protein HM2_08470 [Candidatus Rickettsia kotlanii]